MSEENNENNKQLLYKSFADGRGFMPAKSPEQIFTISSTSQSSHEFNPREITRIAADEILSNMSITRLTEKTDRKNLKSDSTVRDELQSVIADTLEESGAFSRLEELVEGVIELEKNVECRGMTLVEFRDEQAKKVLLDANALHWADEDVMFEDFLKTKAGKVMQEAVSDKYTSINNKS